MNKSDHKLTITYSSHCRLELLIDAGVTSYQHHRVDNSIELTLLSPLSTSTPHFIRE